MRFNRFVIRVTNSTHLQSITRAISYINQFEVPAFASTDQNHGKNIQLIVISIIIPAARDYRTTHVLSSHLCSSIMQTENSLQWALINRKLFNPLNICTRLRRYKIRRRNGSAFILCIVKAHGGAKWKKYASSNAFSSMKSKWNKHVQNTSKCDYSQSEHLRNCCFPPCHMPLVHFVAFA